MQASEAKTHLPRLLSAAERGETTVITRHGSVIARIVPEASMRQQEVDDAIAEIQAVRQQTGRLSREDILSARHEGHRH